MSASTLAPLITVDRVIRAGDFDNYLIRKNLIIAIVGAVIAIILFCNVGIHSAAFVLLLGVVIILMCASVMDDLIWSQKARELYAALDAANSKQFVIGRSQV